MDVLSTNDNNHDNNDKSNNQLHVKTIDEIYSTHLKNINGLFFTKREMDIIACILAGRTSKVIASFLFIAPKTVDNHIHNIMGKLQCNSREQIIDFIEKSESMIFIRQYYELLRKINEEPKPTFGTAKKSIPQLKKNYSLFTLLSKGIANGIAKRIEKKFVFVFSLLILFSVLFSVTGIHFFNQSNKVTQDNDRLGKATEEKLQHKLTDWNIPRQDIIFIGREELLKELENKLHYEENASTVANTLAISACAGLGGIGKSQLALHYAHHTKHPYTLKAWFASEHVENLQKRYQDFAKMLGYKGEGNNSLAIIDFVKLWLSEHPGWLIIFDNVNNYQEIEPFLPEKGGHVIITTRQRQWPANFKLLSVDVMTEQESINVIHSITKLDLKKEDHSAKELVKTLDYLPLALVQAAAYIHQNNITIQQYLELFKNYELELLSENTFPEGLHNHPIAVTWNISLEAIIKEAKRHHDPPIAIELLTVCAYLAPEKISRELLLSWLKQTYPDNSSHQLTLNKHLGLLWRYSMINYDDHHISIHRLVQTVLRHQLQNSFNDKNNNYVNLNLTWFESLLKFFIENESDFKLSNSFGQLLKTREQFKTKLNHQYNDILAELDLIISPVYFNQEKYDEYFKHLNMVNQYLQTKEGLEFLKCKILYLYSAYYRKIAKFDEAQKKLEESMSLLKKLKPNKDGKEKELKKLKAKLLYNTASLYFAKNKKLNPFEREQKEMKDSIKLAREAMGLFKEAKDVRDWLRSLELYGRILVLNNDDHKTIQEFNQNHHFIEHVADDRTRMLFYMTYSDAFTLNKKFDNALDYCYKATEIAQQLNLKNEILNLNQREKSIKEAKNSWTN